MAHWSSLEIEVCPRGTVFIGVAPITQVMHVQNKNCIIQGRLFNAIKVIFHTIKNCS